MESDDCLTFLNVVTGEELQDFINKDDGDGKLQDDQPLINVQVSQMEDHGQGIHIDDHEVKGEGEGHGSKQPEVDPWGMRTRDWFSDKLLRALHISMVTSTDRAMVMGASASKISHSTPAKSSFSAWHCMKWDCW